jgi:hypothetical protein
MDHGVLHEGEKRRISGPELRRNLLGEGDRDPEAAGGRDGESAPAEDPPPVDDGAQEDRLEVQAQQKGSVGGSGAVHGK